MGPSPFRAQNCGSPRRPPFVAFLCGVTRVASVSALAALPVLGGCAPKLSTGEWQCAPDTGAAGASDLPGQTDPVAVPWSDGFEDGFCNYSTVETPAYCYGDGYALVSEPQPNSGRFAAEFKVIGADEHQTRCVHQGEFPLTAYYSAWYYIPQPPSDANVWNLWHFRGGDDPGSAHDLWDVSLGNGVNPGDWELMVLDRPSGFENYRSAGHVKIPIGRWFHIELFLKRTSDSTGEVALYQDDQLLFDRTNLKSDVSKFMQFYFGDWTLNPMADAVQEDSHLYVDDISIRTTPKSSSATP